jgi:hypothetical protein
MWHLVDLVWTDVSEERISSIFRVEKSVSEEPAWAGYWVFWTGDSVCSHLLTLVPRLWIFLPWRWKWYLSPKRRLTEDLHGATSQKTVFFKFKLVCDVWGSQSYNWKLLSWGTGNMAPFNMVGGHQCFIGIFCLHFPVDRGCRFLQYVGIYLQNYTVSHPRRY